MKKLLIALASTFTVLAASATTPSPAAAPAVVAPVALAAPATAAKEVTTVQDKKKVKAVKHPAKKVLTKKKSIEAGAEATKG